MRHVRSGLKTDSGTRGQHKYYNGIDVSLKQLGVVDMTVIIIMYINIISLIQRNLILFPHLSGTGSTQPL
jgi:hypothetical protein